MTRSPADGGDAKSAGSDRSPGSARAGAFSRRRLLAGSGALGTGVAAASLLAACTGGAPGTGTGGAPGTGTGGGDPTATVAFHGIHQAGVTTPQQAYLALATFDVTAADRAGLGSLLATWSAAAARMAVGLPATVQTDPTAPPGDTGEALGLGPSRLTVTVGYGPGLFSERFGLTGKRPAALAELPAFPGDQLDPTASGGDLCLQACADDAQVAFHAVHNLTRLAFGAATLRSFQTGFGFGADGGGGGPAAGQGPPRNLLGFHDGTANRSVLEGRGPERVVWVDQDTDQAWMRGGTYLVARRIRIALAPWARTSLNGQEASIGRHKASGAPLGATGQYDPPPYAAVGPTGSLVIPASAHIRRASPTHNGGTELLRRGYNYTAGVDPLTGEVDAGLIFLCFQRDPRRQFVPIQQSLAAGDALTQGYLVHTASGVFACPPGTRPSVPWGVELGLA